MIVLLAMIGRGDLAVAMDVERTSEVQEEIFGSVADMWLGFLKALGKQLLTNPGSTCPVHLPMKGKTMAPSRITIPARCGKAIELQQGQEIRVINTHGQQVVDTWAFNRTDLSECMSMEHLRTTLGRIFVQVGDPLVTTRRRPIVRLIADTSPGLHDTLLAACDRYRYELLGCLTYHDNCTDNLAAALAELGLVSPKTPSPWNLFMNIPVQSDGQMAFEPPLSQAGDYVLLRAEMDCIVAFSACPQDMVPINGVACTPTEAHVEIL